MLISQRVWLQSLAPPPRKGVLYVRRPLGAVGTRFGRMCENKGETGPRP